MKYEIYCDESCIEALFNKDSHKYAVIGGIWIPSDERSQLKEAILALKKKYNFWGEMKWKKVSTSSVGFYKEVVSLFFNTFNIRFRAICIEAEKVNNDTFNGGSGELGFYKFYFQLIHHWLIHDNEYCIFLDHKVNADKHRVTELGKILQATSTSRVLWTQALPSEQSLLIQLADVLTGAVAASFNCSVSEGGPKSQICGMISQFIGHPIQKTSKGEQKFNVFDINLRVGW